MSEHSLEAFFPVSKEPPSKKILVVDDDNLILTVLEMTLKQEGYEIFATLDPQKACKLIKEIPFAVIICDQRMPEISGIELLKLASDTQPDAMRILLTGNADMTMALEAINIGKVDLFITKPWNIDFLKQAVLTGVEKYRLIKENRELQELIGLQHKRLKENHEKLTKELLLGAQIHNNMLLGKIPRSLKGVEIAAITIPSRDIDGDFFDFYQAATFTFDLVIGDVMGKGIPAALVGTAVKSQLARFATPYQRIRHWNHELDWHDELPHPKKILDNLQKELSMQLIHLEFFVTLFYGRFDLKKRRFIYVDCGSVKPCHYKIKDQQVVELKGSNFPFGSVEKDNFQEFEISYGIGDIFVFSSDGITEAKASNHEQYGTERLHKVIIENASESSETIAQKIKESVIAHAANNIYDDDVTLIVVKITNNTFPVQNNIEIKHYKSNKFFLKEVRDFISHLCQKAPGEWEKLSYSLQLAINEAFCNIVDHGYKGFENSDIVIRGECVQEGVWVQLSDQGTSFSPEEIPNPDFSGNKERGFGWYLIKSLTDSLAYLPKNSLTGWNHLKLFKKYVFLEPKVGNDMELNHKIEDGILIVTPQGESLDAREAPLLKEKLTDLIHTINAKNAILDISNFKFIDSSGLGALLSLLRTLHARGGELKLTGMGKTVRVMFELVSMHKIFEIYPTIEEALLSFK